MQTKCSLAGAMEGCGIEGTLMWKVAIFMYM